MIKDSVSITIASVADIPLIRDIAFQTWPDTFSSILTTDQIAYMLGWMYHPDTLRKQIKERKIQYFLVEGNSGFAAIEMNHEAVLRYAKIHKLYFLPERQTRGLGFKTIEFLSEMARQSEQKALILNVNKNNRATHFYEKTGFKRWKEEVIDIGGGYVMDDFVYRKML